VENVSKTGALNASIPYTMHEFHTRRRIEFADTDLAGICHFARFFIFMETAEHEFLAALGRCVTEEEDGQRIGWPRVAASCDYLAPARFGDVLDLRVRVIRKGRTSLTYAHEITRDGTPVARGRITSVCCRLPGDGKAEPIPIPQELAEKIEEAPG
jgi:acyl-CoA thioester hydrolase